MASSAAIIGAPTDSDVIEDTNLQPLIAAGLVSISDANARQAAFKTTVTLTSDNLGTLTSAANGSYTYSVANSAIQYLKAGKAEVSNFTMTSLDRRRQQDSKVIFSEAEFGNSNPAITTEAPRECIVLGASRHVRGFTKGDENP